MTIWRRARTCGCWSLEEPGLWIGWWCVYNIAQVSSGRHLGCLPSDDYKVLRHSRALPHQPFFFFFFFFSFQLIFVLFFFLLLALKKGEEAGGCISSTICPRSRSSSTAANDNNKIPSRIVLWQEETGEGSLSFFSVVKNADEIWIETSFQLAYISMQPSSCPQQKRETPFYSSFSTFFFSSLGLLHHRPTPHTHTIFMSFWCGQPVSTRTTLRGSPPYYRPSIGTMAIRQAERTHIYTQKRPSIYPL